MERMRRVVAAIVLGCCLLLSAHLAAPGASAGAQWCDTDPVVVIATPAGALVPVYVNNGVLGLEHESTVLLASMPYTVVPVAGGTEVHLSVTIPNDLLAKGFPTRSVVSTGPLGTGTIYATASGVSGKPMLLTFTLDVR
jgi:hypothetical protein